MTQDTVTRRLSAILAADVVGYSRLMETDEVGTLAALKALRKGILQPLVAQYQGRIFKIAGDAVLIEFASPVNAVQCALDLQGRLIIANRRVPGDCQINLRIGINLGDVMVEGGDLYGDGVNIAARLEGLAYPGGVLISESAYDHVTNKVGTRFDDLGLRNLKNIVKPIRVYRAEMGDQSRPVAATGGNAGEPMRSAKVSIAVLAFANLSGDPEQEYFAEGIAEDIITALSRFHSFFVIARNSSFVFKGQTTDVKEVARDLGVRYVIEGSVRKAGLRVRVSARLIDISSGARLWAERYDRDLGDIFAVQDEITQSIVLSIAPEFENAEMRRASRSDNRTLTVWDLVMQARWHLAFYTRQSSATARQLLLEATALDDRNSQAHSLLAMTHWIQSIYGWTDSVEQSNAAAMDAARRAVSLDAGDAAAQATLGIALTLEQHHDEAIETLNRAVRLNPNLASAYGWLGLAYTFACDFELGVQAARQALMLSQRDLDKAIWMGALSFAALAAGRYAEVLEVTDTMLREKPNLPTALRHRAAALALLGREAEARHEIERLLSVAPDTTVSQVQRVFSIRDAAVEQRWLDGLRRAGLPE